MRANDPLRRLFGAATAYPEYRTSYNSVRERYDNLVRYVEDNGVPTIEVVGEPISVVPAPPATIVYEEDMPVHRTVVIDDRRAVVVDDDPDTAVLNGQAVPLSGDPENRNADEVVYYDDDDVRTPRPRRE
jgi:hypothetical protein